MSNISSFPTAIPDGDDLILGSQTDVAGTPYTKNFTVQSIIDLVPGGGGGGPYLPLAGGAMSGNISLELNNITGVDTLYGLNASITNVNATNLYGTFWGTIDSTATATTQAISNNSTKVATTEYVDRALSLGYTSLVQLLTQTSTNAPVATEVYNNTGQTFTWSYVSQGTYRITSTGTPFTLNKTLVFINTGSTDNDVFEPRWSRISDTVIEVVSSSDNFCVNGSFEIKIYN